MSGDDNGIRIVIGGPPSSGKTTFTYRLTIAGQELKFDVESMGYDPWDQALLVMKIEIDEPERIRRKRGNYDDDDLRKKVSLFKEFSQKHSFVIGDLPGRLTDNLNILLDGGTHAIILCSEKQLELIDLWKERFSDHNIPILAIIVSSEENKKESIFEEDGLIKGLLTNLDRTKEYSPAFVTLATLLKKKLQI